MPTLRTIEADLDALDDLLEQRGGEVSDGFVLAAFETRFAEAEANRAKKLAGYCDLIAELNEQAVAAKAAEEQFAKKRKTRLAKVAWLEERLKQHMEARKLKKIEAGPYTIRVQTNGAQKLRIDDSAVPPAFLYQPPTPPLTIDKEAIVAALKEGTKLDFARYEPPGTHVRIA